MILLTLGILVTGPLMSNTYSPFSSIIDDIIESPGSEYEEYDSDWQSPFKATKFGVTGAFVYGNGTQIVSAEVRIFGTDDLISETVFTDITGRIYSNNYYSDGQVLTLSILENTFKTFIPYTVQESDLWGSTKFVDLGPFIVE